MHMGMELGFILDIDAHTSCMKTSSFYDFWNKTTHVPLDAYLLRRETLKFCDNIPSSPVDSNSQHPYPISHVTHTQCPAHSNNTKYDDEGIQPETPHKKKGGGGPRKYTRRRRKNTVVVIQ